MSTPRTLLQRTAVLTMSVATATGLAWAGSTASAHPGVFDSETCAESLTRVWSWPGPLSADGPPVFSDAYESYLLRQPPCALPDRPSPSRSDDSRVGHGLPL